VATQSTILGHPSAPRARIIANQNAMFVLAFAAVIAAMLLLASSRAHAQSASSPWPMAGHDAAHTGLSEYDTSVNPGTVKWETATARGYNKLANVANLSCKIGPQPVIGTDGTIYVTDQCSGIYFTNYPYGTYENLPSFVYAMNRNGGRVGSFLTPGYVECSPAIGSDGTMYVSGSGQPDVPMPFTHAFLEALSPIGGTKWQLPYADGCVTVGGDGTIYSASPDDHLYAINPDGREKWAFATAGPLSSSAAIGGDGTIYVGSGDNNLYAINPDGTEKWAFAASVGTVAVGADGTIYAPSADGDLYAINPDGTEKWAFVGPVGAVALGSDGTIYAASSDGHVYAINPDGTQKWAFPIFTPAYLALAIGSEGTIYASSAYLSLYAINPDGTEKWEGEGGLGLAIGAHGTIYTSLTNNGAWGPNGRLPGVVIAVGPAATTVSVSPVSAFVTPIGNTITKNVTVNNTGSNPLYINSFSLSGAAELTLGTSTCPTGATSLAPGGTCTIAIGFTPHALDTVSATLTLIDNTLTGATHRPLFGRGKVPETLRRVLSFGSTAQSASKTRSLTMTNSASVPITLTGTTVSGPNAEDFAVGGNCGGSLAGSSSCFYAVTFTPATETEESATLSIAVTEDPTSPRLVALSGTGISPLRALPLAGQSFGTVTVGNSLARNVTVRNLGSAAVSLSESIGGPNAADFAVTGGTCGTTLAGASSCNYKVTFTPSVAGAESATIGVSAVGDAASPHDVNLTGTGQ
jgi:outer membrane protein assembly factor BamB